MHDNPRGEAELAGHERMIAYRCACGTEVRLPKGGLGRCGQCGRRIALKALDAVQTVSFCGDLDSGESFHLTDGPDRSGEELGHFRLLAKLGTGGMGAVYRSLDESLQRFVAVKVIRARTDAGSSSARQVGRLLDEAVAQARLNHPNVVTIYYVGRAGEEPFFAMELLPGPTLATVIQSGPLPYKDVILYAQQIVSALRQANMLGLVHGDIKPSNLILADASTVKLGDFGLAHTESTSPIEGISGTLNYMAPELSRGAEPSGQSDMYSLGVTLFELTFGRRPYTLSGTTLREQVTSHQAVQVEFPEKWPRAIPERWRDVLEKLMARNPQDRYAEFEDVERELRALAPVGVTAAGLLTRGVAWVVDLSLQGLLLLPFIIAPQLRAIPLPADLSPLVVPFLMNVKWLGLFAPLVPALFAWAEWHGWRTPGRYLFQLRVADSHGLWLSRRKRILRNLVRNLPIWGNALGAALVALQLGEVVVILTPLVDALLVINIVPVLGPARLALHDRLVRSHVVLDTARKR